MLCGVLGLLLAEADWQVNITDGSKLRCRITVRMLLWISMTKNNMNSWRRSVFNVQVIMYDGPGNDRGLEWHCGRKRYRYICAMYTYILSTQLVFRIVIVFFFVRRKYFFLLFLTCIDPMHCKDPLTRFQSRSMPIGLLPSSQSSPYSNWMFSQSPIKWDIQTFEAKTAQNRY